MQIAGIAERYKKMMMAQMQSAGAASTETGEKTDGTVQMGMNLQKMLESQKAQAEENKKVFGVEKVENFTSMRTKEGDLLVLEVHQAAKRAIKELHPEIQVGLTLSLHDIQVAEEGGEVFALSSIHRRRRLFGRAELYSFSIRKRRTDGSSGRCRTDADGL